MRALDFGYPLFAALAPLLLSAVTAGCSSQPVSVPVRSLEQSGRVAFMCLTGDPQNRGAWLDDCAQYADVPVDYRPSHLYALVTQETRGEVALVDLTAETVVDLDPSKPGFNFIPIGANPEDIVATPGGTAAFVGSSQANRSAIYVLPSATFMNGPSHLTSYAACALPSAPGAMTLVYQPQQGTSPTSCDGQPLDQAPHPYGDLSKETKPAGVRKLVVALPDLGTLALIDAQSLLDRPAGSFDACPIERYLPLRVQLPSSPVTPQTPEGGWAPGKDQNGGVCQLTALANSPSAVSYEARPSGFSYDAESATLYVADEGAPVVHVVDLSSPCQMSEKAPLLPSSVLNPDRTVLTRELAVSPTTSDGRKFLYATDFLDGSAMVFDVSVESTNRTPVQRAYPDRSPFQAPDRLSFAVPIKSMTFALRDQPIADAVSGAAPLGTLCDPSNDGALGAGYRPASDLSAGAGPGLLRGVFAFLALTNGQIIVVDVDDFDAPCRRPKETGACPHEAFPSYQGASGEASCNVVERHQPRSSVYYSVQDNTSGRLPTMATFPMLTLDNGVLPTDQTEAGRANPKLLAPQTTNQVVLVGGRAVEAVESDPSTATHNMVVLDMREPRVQYEQNWTITYEGQIPGFGGHVGRINQPAAPSTAASFHDPGAYFCDRGVHDFDAVFAQAKERGLEGTLTDQASAAYQWAAAHQDVVEITSDFLDKDDPYWGSVKGQCSLTLCKETFGLPDAPLAARDFTVREAYQDHLVVEGLSDIVHCCFPILPTYTVRALQQWVVVGAESSFLHHVVADPNTGRCIDSCDPTKRLLNGRALELTPGVDAVPSMDDKNVFRNPLMQFVVWHAQANSLPSVRDMTFLFRQNGGFSPLMVNLTLSSSYIQPQSIQYVPQLGQLAIPDGSVQGLILIDVDTLSVLHRYY